MCEATQNGWCATAYRLGGTSLLIYLKWVLTLTYASGSVPWDGPSYFVCGISFAAESPYVFITVVFSPSSFRNSLDGVSVSSCLVV